MTTPIFSMAELLDYEAQLARDSLSSSATLEARDRPLRKIVTLGDKRASLHAWIERLRQDDGAWPGTKAQNTYDTLALVAIILGLLSGTGLIQGLLHYDGSQPVNIIPILAIYAALQILLLINYIFKAAVYRLFKRLPGGALIYCLREAALRWIHKHPRLIADRGYEKPVLKAFGHRLNTLHRGLLQNHAWKLVQDFGIACHAASLLTFVALIFFNDYTFGWRTTLHLEPLVLHRITEVLAWPFAWLGDFTQPGLDVIQHSQFSRYQKGFIQSSGDLGARSTAAWWPFLALVIATYGLLPRIVLWIILEVSIKKELQNQTFSDFQSEALWQRLKSESITWDTDASLEPSRAVPAQNLYQLNSQEKRDCIILRWRDLPVSQAQMQPYLLSQFGLNALALIDGGGRSRDVDTILAQLKSQTDLTLLIAADPWELPGEAIEKIRQAIRKDLSKTLTILFAPLEQKGESLRLSGDPIAWRHALQAFRDPYLGLLEERS